MSYTLRGRVDSRLFAALGPAVAAAILALALHRWWPVEIAALMVGVGLALDVLVYDRVFDYQPGWVALPLGALELGLVMAVGGRGPACGRRSAPAIAFFCGGVAARAGPRARGAAVAPALVRRGRRRARPDGRVRGRRRRRRSSSPPARSASRRGRRW